MQTPGLPDDVLVLEYAELAPQGGALGRLQVLAAIGHLLAKPAAEVIRLSDLTPEPAAQDSLRVWLMGEPAKRFWHLRDDHVHVQQRCEKHILVGTRQLLADLSAVRLAWPPPDLADLDWIWQAAVEHMAQHGTSLAGEAHE